jgi:hypothetical protein
MLACFYKIFGPKVGEIFRVHCDVLLFELSFLWQ